jgi:hypothetical protein
MMRHLGSGLRAAAAGWSLAAALFCAAVFSARATEQPAAEQPAAEQPAAAANGQPSPSDQPPPAVPKAAAPAPARCIPFRIRPQDQLWAVSTRHLGCGCAATQEPSWRVWRYDHAAKQWVTATAAEFYETDSADVVTTFYIHGNRIDHCQAFSDGMDVYFQLAGKLDIERPVRFVIWSWPSSQIKGPLKDVRAKAWRTDADGYYLARFLADMQPEVQVGLLGYSYGARIITGAMHLLGGGSLAGKSVPPGERPVIRAAFWAAALHNHWLLPGHYHGQALTTLDRCFVTYNCCDPVLSRYHWLEKCGNPVAMGYSGVYGRNLLPPELNSRLEEMNVTCLVGGTHDMRPYLYSLPIQNRTREYVLWHELDEARPAAQALAAATP